MEMIENDFVVGQVSVQFDRGLGPVAALQRYFDRDDAMHEIVDVEPELRAIGFIELRNNLQRRLLTCVSTKNPLADNLGRDAVHQQIALGIKRCGAQIEIERESLNVEPPGHPAETAIGNPRLPSDGEIVAGDVRDQRQLYRQLCIDFAFAGSRQWRCLTHGTNGKRLDRLEEGSKVAAGRERDFRVRARHQHIGRVEPAVLDRHAPVARKNDSSVGHVDFERVVFKLYQSARRFDRLHSGQRLEHGIVCLKGRGNALRRRNGRVISAEEGLVAREV